jgi:hypothetical protein
MKGFITRALAMACGAVLLAASSGCYTYDDLVDPCYPERYRSMSRHETNEASEPQIHNGHVLDQTVWNYMFEPGTDRLLPGGLDHLAYLARRRPAPDCMVYMQTAQDISYDADHPEKFAEWRCELDAKRIAAVQKYLTADTAGRHIDFQVTVIDPSDPGIAAIPANLAVQRMYAGSTGILTGAGAAASGPTGGGGAAAGGR